MQAILQYQSYDRLPVVHFGFWDETLIKWHQEGHLTKEEAYGWKDGNEFDAAISRKLGFDFNWGGNFDPIRGLFPEFETKVVEQMADGFRKEVNNEGVIVLKKEGVVSIPSEVDHLLKDRANWEEHYLPRLQFTMDRIDMEQLTALKDFPHENPLGLYCGSLFGWFRNWMGIAGVSYLLADDEGLYDEIIDTVAKLCHQCLEKVLSLGIHFDFGHFWEDICFKNGPLVSPRVFAAKVGPHYRRITDLLRRYGIDIVSLDCDGLIDALIPTWLENGVNTMFPIEVGTWDANIKPWREKYGKEIRGVGGMDKKAFIYDDAAIDAEIERLKPLVDLGGYIPCPDHRIAPDAQWDNVRYYCDRMHQVFG